MEILNLLEVDTFTTGVWPCDKLELSRVSPDLGVVVNELVDAQLLERMATTTHLQISPLLHARLHLMQKFELDKCYYLINNKLLTQLFSRPTIAIAKRQSTSPHALLKKVWFWYFYLTKLHKHIGIGDTTIYSGSTFSRQVKRRMRKPT